MWCVRQIKGDRKDRKGRKGEKTGQRKRWRQKRQTKTGPEKKTEGGQFINRSFAEASLTFTSPPLLLHCFFPLPAPIKDHKMWNWPINEKLLHWLGYIWISGQNTVGYFSYRYSNCVNWFPSMKQRVTLEACEYYDLSESWEQRPEWPHNNDWHGMWCNWNSSVACICIQTIKGMHAATKTDEFSEKFQTAFDPPPHPPSFSENHIADFLGTSARFGTILISNISSI